MRPGLSLFAKSIFTKTVFTETVRNEIRQNRFYLVALFLVSICFGASLMLTAGSAKKIALLSTHETWNTDLVILPKGISLEDFRKEILSGQTQALLPEAMFNTTVELAQSQFKLGAILPLRDAQQKPMILVKGDHLGLSWLPPLITQQNWAPQTAYQTPEWGTHVIAGFFASGPENMMKNLKDLIDRKTVGQAYWIKEQEAKDQELQMQLFAALKQFTLLAGTLGILGFLSLLSWLYSRLKESFLVLREIGISHSLCRGVFLCLVSLFIALPISLGALGVILLGGAPLS